MKPIHLAAFLLGLMVIAAPAAARQAPDPQPIRTGGEIRQPIKVKDLQPVYPATAQRAGISGVVILEAIIGADGKVTSARVLRSSPQLQRFDLLSVSLQKRPAAAGQEFWFYQIALLPIPPPAGPPMMAIVLMNGSIVEPETLAPVP